MKAVIFDLDGTLADCGWRLHHIQTKLKNWKAFFDGIPDDPPTELVRVVDDFDTYKIVFCTGRSENYRQVTEQWIDCHVFDGAVNDNLYMRKNNDHRPDYVAKKDMLAQMRIDGFDPVMVFDDKPEVCEMFRKEGLLVMQVIGGNKNG